MMTDEAAYYTLVGQEFAEHGIVRPNKGEYGRGEVHTNTIEGYFSIFKRGMKGVYQHCGKKNTCTDTSLSLIFGITSVRSMMTTGRIECWPGSWGGD